MKVYLNGEFLPREKATLSIDDRGFLFGDGIYEVIRSVEGRIFRLEQHLKRLDHGLKALGIQLSDDTRHRLPAALEQLLVHNELMSGQATLYLQITRGATRPRQHAFPSPESPPTVMINATPFQPNIKLQEQGAYAVTTPDVRWSRCNLKTVNLLPNVLAAQKARENHAFGALMVRDGFITEGYNNNVFAVMNDRLVTHPDSPLILSGITREVVFEMAEEADIPVIRAPISEKDILKADEVILTGTTTDIQPVIRINDEVIAGGEPGPVARMLQEGLSKQMRDG